MSVTLPSRNLDPESKCSDGILHGFEFVFNWNKLRKYIRRSKEEMKKIEGGRACKGGGNRNRTAEPLTDAAREKAEPANYVLRAFTEVDGLVISKPVWPFGRLIVQCLRMSVLVFTFYLAKKNNSFSQY